MYTVAVYFHRYIYVPANVNLLQAHACARHDGRRWTCTVVVLVLVLARLVRCRGHARPALRTNAKRTQSAPRICRTDGRTDGRRVVLADRSNVQLVPSSSSSSVGTPGYSDRRVLWRSGSGPAWMRRLPPALLLRGLALASPCLGLLGPAPPRPARRSRPISCPPPPSSRSEPNSPRPYPPPASQGQGRPRSIAVPTATSTTAAGVWAGRHAARSHTSMDPVATCRASAGAPQFFTICLWLSGSVPRDARSHIYLVVVARTFTKSVAGRVSLSGSPGSLHIPSSLSLFSPLGGSGEGGAHLSMGARHARSPYLSPAGVDESESQ